MIKLKLIEKEGAAELRETELNVYAEKLGLYDRRFPYDDQCGGYQLFRWLVHHPASHIDEFRASGFHPNIRVLVLTVISNLRFRFYGDIEKPIKETNNEEEFEERYS